MNDKNFNSGSPRSAIEFHDCEDVVARLGDLVDQDLPSAERAAMENHLDECPECASFYASYKHVVESAAELREPERPLTIDIQNRLRKALNDQLGINLPFIA